MTNTGIIFEEPPVSRGGMGKKPSQHWGYAEELRKRPKEWARIKSAPTRSSAASTAHQIGRAILRAYAPPGAFEASARTINGEHWVYARYLGDAGGETE